MIRAPAESSRLASFPLKGRGQQMASVAPCPAFMAGVAAADRLYLLPFVLCFSLATQPPDCATSWKPPVTVPDHRNLISRSDADAKECRSRPRKRSFLQM